jgi:dipeptidyl aminopeptidase/acylaminoacyl peptidase
VLVAAVAATLLLPQGALAAPPSWIYYLVHPTPPAGALHCNSTSIWRVRPDGSSPQEVLPGAYDDFVFPDDNGASQTDGEFSVSPDGRYIVRVLAAPTPLGHTNEAHLYLYDLQAGTVRQLTSDPGVDRWPAISPNDQTVAFTHTTYRKPEMFGAGAETTVTETVPLSGGTPQIVHETPGETGNRQISWVSNSTFEQEGAGAVTVNVATGRTTQWLRPTHAYDPLVFSSTWTPFGLLYTSRTLTLNGSLRHRPVEGLYLAAHPVNVTGSLLRRYKWSVALPPANGLYSLQLLPGTRTLVAERLGHLVTGPLAGALHTLAVPSVTAARPEIASGPETLPPPIPTPAAGAAPACA